MFHAVRRDERDGGRLRVAGRDHQSVLLPVPRDRCQVPRRRALHGPINLDETLHLLTNAKLVTGTLGAPLGITLNIANGDFVMESSR